MSRTLLFMTLLMLSHIALTGCSSSAEEKSPPTEEKPEAESPPESPPPAAYGLLYGQLVNASSGAEIKVATTLTIGGTTVTTNDSGFFAVQLEAEKPLNLRVALQGYASSVKPIVLPAEASSFLQVRLLKFTGQSTFQAESGGSVDTRGAKVDFPADALEAEGEVTAYIARLDASIPDELAAFPGGFRTSTGEILESFGALAVEVRDENGAQVAMRSNSSASIVIPASDNVPAGQIPLWRFDEPTGVWIQEGALEDCESGACTGTIDSLAWWNADKILETTCLVICANNAEGQPAAGLSVQARGIDYHGISSAFSSSDDGCACVDVRIDSRVEVSGTAAFGVVGPAEVRTANQSMVCGDLRCPKMEPPLVAETPKFMAILTWGAEPRDIASHWSGPCAPEVGGGSDCRFLVSWLNYGSLKHAPYATLNTDVTTGYGPEIVTMTRCFPGVYRLSVQHYAGSGTLMSSEASVQLLLPDGSFERVSVATEGMQESDRVWIVGDMTCRSGCDCTWKTLNQFGPWNQAVHP